MGEVELNAAATWIVHSGAPGTRGNAYEFQWNGARLLVDCGESNLDWIESIDAPTAVIVTHAHNDHAGGLIRLRERFPTLRVVTTLRTRTTLGASLTSRVDAQRATAISDTLTVEKFHETIPIAEGLDVRLIPAGHVPGAAMVEIAWGEHRMAYTGDLSLRELACAGVAQVDAIHGVDLLVIEGVLSGARALDEFDASQELTRLKTWLSHDGPRLLAVEGIGEAPELAVLLAELDVVIHQNCQGFLEADTFSDDARAAEALEQGRVVMVSGGKLDAATSARKLCDAILERSDARIALFNGVPHGTFAAEIMNTSRRSRLMSVPGRPRLKARVKRWNWPLHPTFSELIEGIERIQPRSVLLTHGEESALYRLRSALKRQIPEITVNIASVGQSTIIGNP